jgi:hypothetical protein
MNNETIENNTADETNNTSTETVETTETNVEQVEAQPEESAPKTLKSVEAGKVPSTSKESKEKAHVAFLEAARAAANALGFATHDQKGWLKVENLTTGHKLYVARGGKSVKIETTIPTDVLGEYGTAHAGGNGKIASNVVSTVEALNQALEILAMYDAKLPPPRRATKNA